MNFRLCLSTGFCLLAMALLAGEGLAQIARADVFTVRDVHVDVSAENAEIAKFNALRQGRREALSILLRRLTPSGEWTHLPIIEGLEGTPEADAEEAGPAPLAIDGGEGLQPDYIADLSLESLLEEAETGRRARTRIDDDRLEALEAGIEVRNEQNSATRYLADITYAFKPDEIRNLLRNEGIPYSEIAAPRALLLPVLEVDGELKLWEPDNFWADEWRKPGGHDLTPLVTPLAELENILHAPAERVMAGDAAAFAEIAARYGVDRVMVAHASVADDGLRQSVRARLIEAYDARRRQEPDRRIDADRAFADEEEEDEARRFDEGSDTRPGWARGDRFGANRSDDGRTGAHRNESREFGVSSVFVFPRPENIIAERRFDARFSRIELLVAQAQNALQNAYEDDWKTANLINHGEARRLMASAYFQNARDWLELRRAMLESPIVENVHVAALSRDGAFLAIDFLGGAEQLRDMLARGRYELWSEGGAWRIAKTDLSEQLREPLRPDGRRLR
ncbi:MAG: hypothetical protein Tsb0010_16570 [Parvularculaceae bacterium]